MNETLYEIEWRELLIKRLKTAQAALKRDAAAEEKQRAEAKELAAGYASFDEAHEAFGWGYITEQQLDTIKAIFENQENQSRAALKRINDIIGTLQGEINTMRRGDAQDAAIERYNEKVNAGILAPAT